MRKKRQSSVRRVFYVVAFLLLVGALVYVIRPPFVVSVIHRLQGKKTVADRLEQYGDAARRRLAVPFEVAGLQYPPEKLILVGLKKEKQLQVYAAGTDGSWRFVKTYPVIRASGALGPKLREGDGQVPEGIYKVTYLNPNSSYHLSLRLDYPNDFDRKMAALDGRSSLGQDIMIHGSDRSVGCLAMGDRASEDLFVLVADTGVENVEVFLSPVDFRVQKWDHSGLDLPEWTDALYKDVSLGLNTLPLPPKES